MNAILDLNEATREEWLAARKIGSSDAASICGVGWETPMAVFLRMTGQIPEKEETEAMKAGKYLEAAIAQWFADETGLEIKKAAFLCGHLDMPWMTATPDYNVWENGEKGLLEIKNTGFFNADDWEGGIPDAAHVQVAHQLAVTGLAFAYVAGCIGGNKLRYRRIERDQALIGEVMRKEREFWDLVQSNTPPPLCAGDSDLMGALYPQAKAGTVDLDAMAEGYALGYLLHKQDAKEAEEKADVYAAKLKALLRDGEKATAGRFLIAWSNRSRESIDSKALRAEHPEIAQKFSKVSSYRQFSVKEAKDNGKK